MPESMTPSARTAAAQMIEAKRDELLAEQRRLTGQRAEILAQIRKNDRELADCRAAARLFQLEIEFPPDEREEMERQMMLRRQVETEAARREREIRDRWVTAGSVVHRPAVTAPPPASAAPAIASAPAPAPVTRGKSRPPLREIVLEQLKVAGETGAKAAAIRDFIERTYGEILHEKTVGMTLFRLAEKKQARRDGHTWFYVPQSAETKNPGAANTGAQ